MNARGNKKRKSNQLGRLVKSRQNKQVTAAPVEADLDLQNSDFSSLDKDAQAAALFQIKDALLSGILEGVNAEVSDVRAKGGDIPSDVLRDFLDGLKEGMELEIKEYLADQNDKLGANLKEVSDSLKEGIEALADNQPVVKNLNTNSTVNKFMSTEKMTRMGESASFGFKAKEAVKSFALGAMGFEDYAQKRHEKAVAKENYILTEQQLGREDLKDLSARQQRKTLRKEYKQKESLRKELEKNDAKVKQLEAAGYTEEEIGKTKEFTRRKELATKVETIDPRFAVYDEEKRKSPTVPSSTSEESESEGKRERDLLLAEQKQQTVYLGQILSALTGKGAAGTQANAAAPESGGMSLGSVMPDISLKLPGGGPKVPGKPGILSRGAGMLKNVAKFGLRMAGPVAAVAGAGYAGWEAGKLLNEHVIDPTAKAITGDKNATLGSALYDGVDRVQDMAGGFLGRSDSMKAAEVEAATRDKLNKQRVISKLANDSAKQKATSQKPTIITVPAPAAPPASSTMMSAPFTESIHNTEPSVVRYLTSRY